MARRLCSEDRYPAPLLAVAGHGLQAAAHAFPPAPVPETEWSFLIDEARRNRITGQLAAAVEAGSLPATAEQVKQARAAHRYGRLRAMALDWLLADVVDILAAHDIDSRALKGAAVAQLDYADPTIRSYIDVDVMVRSRDIDRAATALAAAGCVRTLAEPRPGFDRRFDKGMTLILPTGHELDLHRTFVLGPWGVAIDLDVVWEGSQKVEVSGRRVDALTRPLRFLHACYHAALGDWPLRLGSLRDVVEIQSRLGEETDMVRRVAAAWGVEAVVAAAVADSHRLLGLPVRDELTAWAAGFVPSLRDEAWLGLHTHDGKTFAAQAVATLRVLPRWRDKAAYVRALVMPDPQYMVDRHRSSLSRFRYAVREIRQGKQGRS